MIWIDEGIGLALALAFACAVALAGFSVLSTGHTLAAPPDSAQSAASDAQILGTDQCLCDFFIVSEIPQQVDYCKVVFGVKHIEQSDLCCNHNAGTVAIRVNGGAWSTMTYVGTEVQSPCNKLVYHSAVFVLPNGVQVSWQIKCSGSPSCVYSGTYTPKCQ